MTTPGQNPPGQPPALPEAARGEGAWAAVGKLLAIQLLTVVAVTAVITVIYALLGGHGRSATAGSVTPITATRSPAPTKAHHTKSPNKPTSTPTPTPTTSMPSSTPTSSSPPTVGTHALKVDVLNQSAPGGAAARTATRVRALGWTVASVADFRGDVSTTTVYYPNGQAKAARDLAAGLPGKPRVLPRFSTLSPKRLTVIVTR
jgi:LytR cell envelope-related transcriptional attenuator